MLTKILRKEVAAFADQMEAELRINDHKGHWRHLSISELLDHLQDEVFELREAVSKGFGAETVLSEAADTANMAMMVADNYKRTFGPLQKYDWNRDYLDYISKKLDIREGEPFDVALKRYVDNAIATATKVKV
jgi:NTP pyrophosphatase (non-canonical NTP hydrolase)